MTENEKAATFIGWVRWTCEEDIESHRQCWKCKKTHDRAPDMTDPRNYMKALEAVDALEVIFQQYDGLQVMIRKDSYHNDKGAGKENAYGFDEESWGDAVVSALAALYDAEHKEHQP